MVNLRRTLIFDSDDKTLPFRQVIIRPAHILEHVTSLARGVKRIMVEPHGHTGIHCRFVEGESGVFRVEHVWDIGGLAWKSQLPSSSR